MNALQVRITLDEIHRPRMWVERHGESEAAMLTFYPQIELGEQGSEMIKVGFPLG